MKNILLLAASSLLAALPAAAVSHGACCAKVHNVCISSCPKAGGCTGQGDCTLAFKTAGNTSIDLDSPAGRLALATLKPVDQARLREITTPPPAGDVPIMQNIPQGPPDLAAPAAPAGTPTLAQLGGSLAKVPMKHGSCGLDCGTHVLAVASGNLDVAVKLGMTCPGGTSVDALSYQLSGRGVTAVIQGNTGKGAVAETRKLQPFSMGELEAACQKALGGSWPLPDTHHNQKKSVKASLEEAVTVRGRCTGWAHAAERSVPLLLNLVCEDRSFPPPAVP
jgi:hypothetical protein